MYTYIYIYRYTHIHIQKGKYLLLLLDLLALLVAHNTSQKLAHPAELQER